MIIQDREKKMCHIEMFKSDFFFKTMAQKVPTTLLNEILL